MNQADYHQLAMDYSKLKEPVIVTDLQLKALYFNPAAAACDVILLTEDCIRDFADARSMQRIRLCRSSGKRQHFLLSLGREYTRRFAVTAERKNQRLIFTLQPRPEKERLHQEKQIEPLTFGFEYIMRSSLHQLLGISELLQHTQDKREQFLGMKSRRQIMRAMRITRQMDFLNNDHPCQVVDFSALAFSLFEELSAFLQEKFGSRIFIQSEGNHASVKCNVMLMRCVLLNMVAGVLQHHRGDIFVSLAETPTDVVLSVRSGNADAESPSCQNNADIPPAALGINIIEELVRRQQGRLLIRAMCGQSFYCLTMPRALTEGAVRETISQYIRNEIPDIEIEFADLL